MITTNDLQRCYIDLYKRLREYLWPFSTVELIADLEVATFCSFPDINDVSSKLNRLCIDIRDCAKEDNDMNDAIDSMRKLLSSGSEIYCKIKNVNEV